jgi:hypothetical protein
MDIPNIRTNTIPTNSIPINSIKILPVRSVLNDVPSIQTYDPPVTVQLGTPIVDIPGCVEAHESNNPLNENLDDSRGILTYCDGNVPSFNPPNYTPNQTLPTRPSTVDTRFNEPDTKIESPRTDSSSTVPTVKCPTPVQETREPVGTYLNGYREKVIAYELIDGTCIRITEPVPIIEQVISGLPSGGQVMQVGGIAVIATTSALLAKPLADILLKVVKQTNEDLVCKGTSSRAAGSESSDCKVEVCEGEDEEVGLGIE